MDSKDSFRGDPVRPERKRSVDDLADEAAERNPDETTRREALELDLQERGRSDEGADVGDEMD
jgi:hypothetical protein